MFPALTGTLLLFDAAYQPAMLAEHFYHSVPENPRFCVADFGTDKGGSQRKGFHLGPIM